MVKYTLSAPAAAGPYRLNSTATKDFSALGERRAALAAQQIKLHGAGHPGTSVFAVYGLNALSESSPDFKAVEFAGYDGTFDPQAVINYEKTQLVSISMVSPGSHGGEMMCGYDKSSGSEVSECLWVTSTTFGEVEFVTGQSLVKFDGNASVVALNVRNGVEVRAH